MNLDITAFFAEKDIKDFFQVLNANEVQYLVVGGHAMAVYGFPRPTGDLDVFVGKSQPNVAKLQTAIKQFGFGETGLNFPDFLIRKLIIQLEIKPVRIDIMNYIDGLEFEESWSKRNPVNFNNSIIYFISKEDLILNKQAGGRAKDLKDLAMLTKKL